MKIKSLLPLSLVLILSSCGQTLKGKDITKEELKSFLTSFDYLKTDYVKSYRYEINEKIESENKTESYKITADYKVSDKETTLKLTKNDDYSYYTLTDEMVKATYCLAGKESTITYTKKDSLLSYESMANTICVDSLVFCNFSDGYVNLAPHGFIFLAINSQFIELANDSSRITKDNSFYYASLHYNSRTSSNSLTTSIINDFSYLKFDNHGTILEAETGLTTIKENKKTDITASYKCSIKYK